MIASNGFKPFGQTILPDTRGLTPDLLKAAQDARKALVEAQDKLFVLENLLEGMMD
jgi:hypothetical protein